MMTAKPATSATMAGKDSFDRGAKDLHAGITMKTPSCRQGKIFGWGRFARLRLDWFCSPRYMTFDEFAVTARLSSSSIFDPVVSERYPT